MKKGGIHYAWFVLVACCMLTFGMGLISYCAGQYLASVSGELGVGMGQLTLYITVQGLGMAFASPFVGRAMEKININLLLTGAYALVILAVAAMGLYTEVWMWYISGAVIGVLGAFCFLIPAPIILGNWFSKKTGFAVGIAMAAAGIGGMIMNPIIATVVADMGWRTAYFVNAAVTAVLVLPFTLFVIKLKPADKGLEPYGYDPSATQEAGGDDVASGVPAKVATKSLPFFLMFIVFGILGFISSYTTFIAPFAASLGLSAAIIGLMASMNSFGNMLSKVALGAISDKFGPRILTFIGFGLVIVAFGLLITGNGLVALIVAGACLLGCANAMGSVGAPLYVRSIFGNKDFGVIFSTLQLGLSLVGALAAPIIGFIYDGTGSYEASFIVGLCTTVAVIVLILISLSAGKKLPREA